MTYKIRRKIEVDKEGLGKKEEEGGSWGIRGLLKVEKETVILVKL